ncbi:DNA mismatch repair endonuclease MutL [Vibrio injensis]|uniref:DNA mismatch repair endonuclease MutL n=1 Tax=Vibrio injensis TaxID=1307414 RepID=UPI00278C3655|nr:DNA mismatch repair endonuclease MutL [Vibrio injensis]EKO3736529.1 DNA mismatch repair endonuclease MutL [Vibrio metschnikovii]EKO3746834.1 DNA mismatch repair endonuclease MutL [Vibrio metschnikovii]
MTIRILPARLANQIAAGEVVERPASVVKELVENSLDSGATRIDIDIEKGGAKLIRVRDNGSGIDKDELGLALSRHATSKIQTLDDLEAILSLGFRGEALASISSVSRLTITSRPATQEEAWSAYSEGRDMAVKLQPSAHPVGTTVEVLDLFFNTPARRKFLRTEKTEFTHIDELLKRIALSRFDVSLTLRHNGKIIRQYRAASSERQEENRLTAVCGASFVKHMLKIELAHQGLRLHGWITTPQGARQQSDLQYCYVNGRMMRDKLINHAIRQSYESSLKPDQFATYVLFIELDPHLVDVNVHPAKHEVRFHQARLVHDFIYQALSGALADSQIIETPELNQAAFSAPVSTRMLNEPLAKPDQLARTTNNTQAYSRPYSTTDHSSQSVIQEAKVSLSWNRPTTAQSRLSSPIMSEQSQAYQQLMRVKETPVSIENHSSTTEKPSTLSVAMTKLGKAVAVVEGQYLLMTTDQGCVLVALMKAYEWRVRGQLNSQEGPLKSQPLLVPLSIKTSNEEIRNVELHRELLERLGIHLETRPNQTVMVMGVPQPLRQQNLQLLIPDLLSYLVLHDASGLLTLSVDNIVTWLSQRVLIEKSDYTLSEAIQLIAELEQLWQGKLPLHDGHFIQPVDFSATIAALN